MTSAFCVKVTVVVALLLPSAESVVVDVTFAVFVTEPLAFDGAEYVAVNVTLDPAVSVPMLHGESDAHATPVLVTDVSVSGAGVGSLSTTPVASDGPEFATVMM
jgi:hypothetical protein